MTAEEVRTSLAAVAQSNFPGENGGEKTCWSCVYDQPEIVNRLIEQLAQRAKCLEV